MNNFQYKFTKYLDSDNKFDRTEVIISSNASTRPQLMADFIDFLAASGFYVDDLKEELELE